MSLPRITIASQMPEPYDQLFKAAVPDADFLPLAPGAPILPPGVEILIALPFMLADGGIPPVPPTGWPFDLRWSQIVTVGTDFYPGWFLDGPPIASGRGNSSVALAEFALASIFAAAKELPALWAANPSEWTRRPLNMVAGATLGIVGFGGVGQALAPRAQALGMKVIALRASDQPMADGVERAPDLETLFAMSDHVVLALPGTLQTKGMISREILAAAKPGLHLVNIARGSLIDDAALLQALDTGLVARASLDVTDPEPLPEGHPFYVHDRIFLSPHNATNTTDNVKAIAECFAVNVDRYRRGETLLDIINPKA